MSESITLEFGLTPDVTWLERSDRRRLVPLHPRILRGVVHLHDLLRSGVV